MSGVRAGDKTRLRYPAFQLTSRACLHFDYFLDGDVQLEVGYQSDPRSDFRQLLCTIGAPSPNDVTATVGSWNSADIVLPTGEYQLYICGHCWG